MRCRFEGDHFVGTILIFPVLAGFAFCGRRLSAGLFYIGFSGIYHHTLLFGLCGRYRTGRITVSVIAGQTIITVSYTHLDVYKRQPCGTAITIRHGELIDEQGKLFVKNLRKAKQTLDVYKRQLWCRCKNDGKRRIWQRRCRRTI